MNLKLNGDGFGFVNIFISKLQGRLKEGVSISFKEGL